MVGGTADFEPTVILCKGRWLFTFYVQESVICTLILSYEIRFMPFFSLLILSNKELFGYFISKGVGMFGYKMVEIITFFILKLKINSLPNVFIFPLLFVSFFISLSLLPIICNVSSCSPSHYLFHSNQREAC